jgi:transcription initiation factor TFIIH subunit 2
MPPVSDDEYIQEVSDDGADNHVVTRGKKKLDEPRGNGARGGGGFEVTRTWESVVEGADGTISGSVQGLLDAGKKRR